MHTILPVPLSLPQTVTSSTQRTSLLPDFDEVVRAINHRITDDGRTSNQAWQVATDELYEYGSGI